MAPAKTDPIIIVGAGVFGLSTALHLGRRGYTDVTIFDSQPYDTTLYSYFDGCDAASADMNKIIRAGYGKDTVYQDLTLESVAGWTAWNDELHTGKMVPPGMTTADSVWVNNAAISMTDADTLPAFDLDSIASMPEGTMLVSTDADDRVTAIAKGLNIEQFARQTPGRPNVFVLDTTGGFACADKACRFALHKARSYGVKTVFGPAAGKIVDLLYKPGTADVTGIATADGKTHAAALTVMACGGWTPTLVPTLDGLNEATAGSVALLKIPRASPYWDKLAPENFPTFMHKLRDGASGGLYGFPRHESGWFKIGYRGTKYTNPQVQTDGKERSVPVTRWTAGDTITSIPATALRVMQAFLDAYLPGLGAAGIHISKTRICWYNDSFDNHLTIDHVSGAKGLMVATSGSGHAFKYLPSLGNWVVDIIEGVSLDRPAVKAWRWRSLGAATPFNVMMEGSTGPRALQNVSLVPETSIHAKL